MHGKSVRSSVPFVLLQIQKQRIAGKAACVLSDYTHVLSVCDAVRCPFEICMNLYHLKYPLYYQAVFHS